jgi:alkylation response protein AidB-like acyl-CoA dehydrogenase
MAHYKSNLRDIEFNLFEVFKVQEYFGKGAFSHMDEETARGLLSEVERLATGPFADGFVEGDRVPLKLEDGNVTVPPAISKALDAYCEGGWHQMNLPEHLGGFGSSPSLTWAATAMLAGANPAALLYCAGPFFAAIADELVTPEQRDYWIKPWVSKQWGATMVLTEPDAGSDVGAGRTKAVDNGDGTWAISGVKRFITNGDFDWPENIIHLALARPEGAGPGTKGLSLFIVPKFWVNADGSLGERNPAVVTNVEDKMGIKASSTCEVTFDNARGVLVGEVHDGIAQMFKVIEYARMLVGTKAIETLSTGYLNALEYAKIRVQGPDLKEASNKAAPRVEIIRHPDVRRSLMMQKAHVEGLRALVMYTASIQDQIALGENASNSDIDLVRFNDLLLPLVKGYGSEKSYELLAQSLQIFGGSGYTRDYPLEQYIRDAKIDTLYEGTTAIQGMDLFFRKIGRDQGETLTKLLGEIQTFAKGDAGNGALQAERDELNTALTEVQAMLGTLVGFLGQDIYLIGLNTTAFLFALAELVIGWLLLRQAEVALAALNGDGLTDADRAFYAGKVASARWFTANVLPRMASHREIMERTDLGVMELDDAAF